MPLNIYHAMKNFLIILLVCFCFSCKNKQDELGEKIEPVLKDNVVKDNLVAKVDSIKIYKIDTLTDVQFTQRQITDLNNKSAQYAQMATKFIAQAKLNQPSGDIKKLNDEIKLYTDSSTTCQLQATGLQKRVEHQKIDSKTFKGYVVLFRLSGSDKANKAVKKDSIQTFLSPDLKVIPATKN